jgi:hypothetical protein
LHRKFIFERDRARLKIAIVKEIDNGKAEHIKKQRQEAHEKICTRKSYAQQVVSDHLKKSPNFSPDQVQWKNPKYSVTHFGTTECEPMGPPNGFRITKVKLPGEHKLLPGAGGGQEWVGIPIMTMPCLKNQGGGSKFETIVQRKQGLVRKHPFLTTKDEYCMAAQFRDKDAHKVASLEGNMSGRLLGDPAVNLEIEPLKKKKGLVRNRGPGGCSPKTNHPKVLHSAFRLMPSFDPQLNQCLFSMHFCLFALFCCCKSQSKMQKSSSCGHYRTVYTWMPAPMVATIQSLSASPKVHVAN